jgi:CheY-like chemotaxis protein
MGDSKRILWVDNDLGYINTFADNLRAEGYDVKEARFVSAAEALLQKERFNLIILDTMIPVLPSEEADYPPEETNSTHNTGLIFFKRWKDYLGQAETPILVMTVRVDEEIARQFKDMGLQASHFFTKHELRRWPDFLQQVKNHLAENGTTS